MKRQGADLVTEEPSPDAGGEARPAGDGELTLPPHRGAVPVGILTAAALIVLDQATKALVEAQLVPGRFVAWLSDDIGWQLVYNPGGAFGLPLPPWVFLVVTVGVLVLITRVLPRTHTLLAAVAYGMLLAGAVGNALDRLLRSGADGFGGGFVVDFVAWGSFPRFNVADSSITVGFVLLVIALLIEERHADALEQGR
jgi:signal peptidase II